MKLISLILILFFLSSCSSSIINQPNEIINPPNEIIDQPTLVLNSDEVMYINSTITHRQANRIRKEADKIKYLVLQSKGGQLDAAFIIAHFVRENGIITIIPKNGYCFSACTVIFQAGVERHAGNNSKLLYHGGRPGRNSMDDYYKECINNSPGCSKWYNIMETTSLEMSEKLFKKLVYYGIDDSFIDKYKNWKKDPDWAETGNFFGVADLEIGAVDSMEYTIVTRIVNYNFINSR